MKCNTGTLLDKGLGECGLSDLFFQSAAFVVLNKLGKRRLVKFGEHVAKLGGFRFAGREGGAVGQECCRASG